MAKRYYWLKLKADWFSDKRIKKLRSIAGSDTHTIIYLKMMLLSLKDEGKLYFEGVEDSFVSEIAMNTSLRKCRQSSAQKQRQPYGQGSAGNGKNSLRLDRKRCNATQMKQAATI